ncbi:rRNA methyltransferase 2, mitochondrial [Diachasma alloeum]|uniref:rRNA methyltransferase 2, mitochondrial n=1 Tax=Diachasma alloeum TaxID=454923 RepID=UPI000738413B|nr:rRNA methyltransferase 2, mitochondrial [Diachasma alloeum]
MEVCKHVIIPRSISTCNTILRKMPGNLTGQTPSCQRNINISHCLSITKDSPTEISNHVITSRHLHTSARHLKKMPDNLKTKNPSSQRWLVRQIQDPYVEKARQENYRCRSAFKLLEINQRFNVLTPGLTVVDCGAAPGSWTQVAVKATNSHGKDENKRIGKVYAIDRNPIHAVEGATILGNLDFTSAKAQKLLLEALNGDKVDVVLSDMAPNASGVRDIDHELITELAYSALKFSVQVSNTEGTFIVKMWDGGRAPQFERDTERFYKSVKIVRPAATRDESTEKFILARGFKGLKT